MSDDAAHERFLRLYTRHQHAVLSFLLGAVGNLADADKHTTFTTREGRFEVELEVPASYRGSRIRGLRLEVHHKDVAAETLCEIRSPNPAIRWTADWSGAGETSTGWSISQASLHLPFGSF